MSWRSKHTQSHQILLSSGELRDYFFLTLGIKKWIYFILVIFTPVYQPDYSSRLWKCLWSVLLTGAKPRPQHNQINFNLTPALLCVCVSIWVCFIETACFWLWFCFSLCYLSIILCSIIHYFNIIYHCFYLLGICPTSSGHTVPLSEKPPNIPVCTPTKGASWQHKVASHISAHWSLNPGDWTGTPPSDVAIGVGCYGQLFWVVPIDPSCVGDTGLEPRSSARLMDTTAFSQQMVVEGRYTLF